jgi:hypothetical protein
MGKEIELDRTGKEMDLGRVERMGEKGKKEMEKRRRN